MMSIILKGRNVQGFIYTVSVNSHTGALYRTHKNKSSMTKSLITTIQYRTFSLVARCSVLLSCAQDGNMSFFRCAYFITVYSMVDFTLYNI
jgi:WD repeat-containing protein 13